jgi:hypothetical protein
MTRGGRHGDVTERQDFRREAMGCDVQVWQWLAVGLGLMQAPGRGCGPQLVRPRCRYPARHTHRNWSP